LKIFIKAIVLLSLVSCSTIYYNTWEFFGQEKRDILESKMENVESSQESASEQLQDSLEIIREKFNFKEGELEETYDDLSDDYDNFEKRSRDLEQRISSAQEVADDLFEEWKEEAYSLDNRTYRKNSLSKRSKTMKSFSRALVSTKKVQKKMDTILKQYKDHVIYLKHNLNAKIIGKLEVEMQSIVKDVQSLIKEIEASKNKTSEFISTLKVK